MFYQTTVNILGTDPQVLCRYSMADACLCPTLGLQKSNPVRQEDIFNANAKIVGH